MILPRPGDTIHVLPFGPAVIVKWIGDGKALVTIDRVLKDKDGKLTNQVVVGLHPTWIAEQWSAP